jgi:hypothetical protein
MATDIAGASTRISSLVYILVVYAFAAPFCRFGFCCSARYINPINSTSARPALLGFRRLASAHSGAAFLPWISPSDPAHGHTLPLYYHC